jgi:hypothetical protein
MNDTEHEIPNLEPISFRINIGVTGHRKLKHPEELQEQVKQSIDKVLWSLFDETSRKIIEGVKQAGTTPILYRVLSPLAEGADRVVARTVLDNPQASLVAVLPLTVEDYLEDFATDESKREFRALLSKSNRPVILRRHSIREDRRDPKDQAELRREAYETAGRYVVNHCDVLIAIWDGKPSKGRGGTAEIVEFALRKERPVIRVWDGVLEVLNREKCNRLDATPITGIERFNCQRITKDQRAEYTRNLNRDFFEKPRTASGIPADTRKMVNRCLFPYYAQASIVAKRSRDAFQHKGRNIYVLSAAAVGCAAAAVLFPPLAVAGFAAELVLLIIMLLTLRLEFNTSQHRTWIEYRFLTERIRAGIFMAICGVDPRPINVPAYMGHSQTVNDWTVRVFNEIWDRLPPLVECGGSSFILLNDYVREAWIGEQVKFHQGKQEREGRMHRKLENARSAVVTMTLVIAALHLLLMLLWQPSAGATLAVRLLHTVLHDGLPFVALLFPAIAASLAGMDDQGEHRRLEKRSENMKEQLERLGKQMALASTADEFENALLDLDEQMMLRETQDWLMLMRFVELKLPA